MPKNVNKPSNQSLEPTPFDYRSGQASWADAMTHFSFMKQLSMFATLALAWISSKFPAYAPASASILFPAVRVAAERRDSSSAITLPLVFTETESPAS